MERKKLLRIVGVFGIIGGVILKSISFATATTEQQLTQRAASTGNAEFLILFGIVLLVVSIFVKNK